MTRARMLAALAPALLVVMIALGLAYGIRTDEVAVVDAFGNELVRTEKSLTPVFWLLLALSLGPTVGVMLWLRRLRHDEVTTSSGSTASRIEGGEPARENGEGRPPGRSVGWRDA